MQPCPATGIARWQDGPHGPHVPWLVVVASTSDSATSPAQLVVSESAPQSNLDTAAARAKQDLVVAVDGSGSFRQGGFDILKKFIKKLLERYETEYFGSEVVKIGIVLFSNGVTMPDGKIVSPAILSQPRTRSGIQDSTVLGTRC